MKNILMMLVLSVSLCVDAFARQNASVGLGSSPTVLVCSPVKTPAWADKVRLLSPPTAPGAQVKPLLAKIIYVGGGNNKPEIHTGLTISNPEAPLLPLSTSKVAGEFGICNKVYTTSSGASYTGVSGPSVTWPVDCPNKLELSKSCATSLQENHSVQH